MDFSLFMSGFNTRCSAGIVRFMRRFVSLVATFMSKVCLAVLRIVIAGIVFTCCGMVMLHFLGLPVKVPSEVVDTFESLGRLARILS